MDESDFQHSPHETETPYWGDRTLDACFNRAAEGLRVVEDILRFVRNDCVLAAQAKQQRHSLGELAARMDASKWSMARNVEQDIGRTIKAADEFDRSSPNEILLANLKRTQQALRTIEELLKPLSRNAGLAAESLRYQVYQLETACQIRASSSERLGDARLCVLVDGGSSLSEFTDLVGELVQAGADLIQLRDKSLDDQSLFERGQQLSRMTSAGRTRWIMNDRADISLLAGAAGVHLGAQDLTVSQARRIVGGERLIGSTVHSMEEVERAVFEGANYLGVGPTFQSSTKKFERLSGVEFLASVAERVSLPWFAIGGITLDNVDQVLQAGAARVAVGGAVTAAASPGAAVVAFREKLAAAAREGLGTHSNSW